MKQFIHSGTLCPGERVDVEAEDYHYLCRVRRARKGNILKVSDSQGNTFRALLENLGEESCTLLIQEELDTSSRSYEIHLYLCLCKGKKQDIMIRQAVEAGVNCITMVDSRYSQVKLNGKEPQKIERWEKIVREARQQSGSAIDSRVNPLITFNDLPRMNKEQIGLFCHQERLGGEGLAALSLNNHREIHLLIGSEGGLADKEIEIMQDKGFSSLYLGDNVLRAETASIFALGAVIAATELI